MITKKISIPFKGNRTYIQGPDLYNVMLKHLAGAIIRDIRFSVHAFIRTTSCILFEIDELSEMKDSLPLPAQLRCRIQNKGKCLFIKEGDVAVDASRRADYDEHRVHRLCSIEGQSISIHGCSPFTFVETIVSMKKELLSRLYPDAEGKWIFTRLDLKIPIEVKSNLTIQLLHNMDLKLIKSGIVFNKETLGHLYFSLLKS